MNDTDVIDRLAVADAELARLDAQLAERNEAISELHQTRREGGVDARSTDGGEPRFSGAVVSIVALITLCIPVPFFWWLFEL